MSTAREWTPAAERARVLPFRRRRFLERHRKRSRWMLLWKPFVGALLLVGLPVAAGTWMLTSTHFSLRQIHIGETARVSLGWVEETLAPYRNRHLLQLRLNDLERELSVHPWVAGVEMTKLLPDRLEVELVERQPAAILRRDDSLHYVDTDGVVVAPYSAGSLRETTVISPANVAADDSTFAESEGASGTDEVSRSEKRSTVAARAASGRVVDLPLIRASAELEHHLPAALATIDQLAIVRPDWHAGLSEVEILNARDLSLFTDRLPCPVRVSADRLEQGIRELEQFLPEILRRYSGLSVIDLRFARQIVIQPAAQHLLEKG